MIKPLLLVLILAGGLRFAGLTFDSFWLDESYQTVVEAYGNGLPDLSNAQGKSYLFIPGKPANCANLLANFRRVDLLCPPLYAVLINRWITILGGSDFALRAFSVLTSILAITAVYFLGSASLNKRCGFYAALLQAISPFDIHYAQEARMYSLAVLFATLSGGSLLVCLREKSLSKRSILLAFIYVISTWALINTHYTQLFTWCAFIILSAFACLAVRKNLSLLGLITVSNLCVIILSIPWFSFFTQAAALRTESFYVIRQSSLIWPLWALLIRIPFNWIMFLAGKKVMLWALPVYITSACLISYSLLAVWRRSQKKVWTFVAKYCPNAIDNSEEYNVLLLLILWAAIPAILIWLLDVAELHKVIEVPRYLIGTAPAIFLIAGYSLSIIENKKFFLSLLTAHMIFCLCNYAYMHSVPQRENWRAIAQTIERACGPNELLFVSPYYNIVCLDRYLYNPLRQIGVSPTLGQAQFRKIIDNIDEGDQNNGADQRRTFWVLSAQEGDTIFNTMPSSYQMVQKYDYGHALHLRQYCLYPK